MPDSTVTIVQIINAVADTLSAATGLDYTQSYDELSEGMQDTPTLQVYFDSFVMDSASRNDRTTFQGRVRQKSLTIFADLYARQRSHIGEDMAEFVPLVDAILDVFEQQDTKPYFGLAGIKSFGPVNCQRVTFTYGDPSVNYIGARFTIPILVW